MTTTRESSDSENNNNDVQYSIVSYSRKGGFFSQPEEKLTENKSPEEVDELNKASISCKIFMLTTEEANQIAECDRMDRELDEKLAELYQLTRQNSQQRKKLQFGDDPELTALLNEKFNQNYPRHECTCKVNKKELLMEITIKDCEDKDRIRYIFGPLLKSTPKIEVKGRAESIDDHLRVIVTFWLRERDMLIEGLKLRNEVYKIPEARKYFQGC